MLGAFTFGSNRAENRIVCYEQRNFRESKIKGEDKDESSFATTFNTPSLVTFLKSN